MTADRTDDRRRRRSSDPLVALHYQLSSARTRGDLDAIVVADPSGVVVAGAGSWPLCEELAAYAPLLAEGDWASMTAETFIEGRSVGKGGAASIPGSPLAAFAYLLGHAASRGRPLKTGQLVTTGASTGIHDIVAGQTSTISFGAQGELSCVAVPAK